jgi:hypothetical protein
MQYPERVVNLLKVRVGGSRLEFCQGVGLGLMLFTALAGTAWAQGGGQGRGQGGMQGGMQGGIQGRPQGGPQPGMQPAMQPIPPPTGGTAANPSGLPHAIGDDTFAQALQRMLIATMATNPKNEALTPLHLRYELKITDYKNKPHTGTYETWISKAGVHTAIHTDAYDDSDLTKGDGVWALEKGLRPLRIMEFAEVHMMYRSVLLTAMRGDQKMKPRTVDGVALTCGGSDDRGAVCFDPATGYISLIIKDTEKVAYEDWKQVGPLHLAATVRKTYGKHELFEAKLTDSSVEVSSDALAIPAGAIQEPAGTRLDEQRGLVFRAEAHPQLPMNMRKPGGPQPTPAVNGQAQLHVWVDDKGMVSKATVEDADDKEAADAGYSRATLLQFIPDVESGKPAAFETSYYMRSMGGFGGGGMGRGRGGGMGAPGGDGGGDAPGTTPGAPPSGGSGGPGGM